MRETRVSRKSLSSFLVGASALGSLALGGCSNNPYPAGESAGPVLYRTVSDSPRTLDPTASYTVGEAAILDLICPSFYRYHYLKRNPYVLELNLGAEPPRREPVAVTERVNGKPVGRQGERWTFRIRRGIRFQDDPCFPGGKGREVTAADFLYSFHRMADPAATTVPCPVVSFFSDKIVGFADYMRQVAAWREKGRKPDYTAPIAGLQADRKDAYTFHILLNQRYPQLRYLMAMHFTTPIPREAVERYGQEMARHPVGCGPFVLSQYAVKQRIVLTKNPNRPKEYYPSEGMPDDRATGLLKDAGKALPLADTVVYTYNKEGITGWNLFLQGYLDGWGVTQDNFRQVVSRQGQLTEEMKRKGVVLRHDVGLDIGYFAFNMDDPVVGGYTRRARKLRQAISTAIDAQAFIDLFSQGIGRRAEYLLPPGIFGYDPSFKNPYRQYSVERAKRLLAEAGYPDGVDPATGDRLAIYFDNTATNAAGRQYVGLLKKQIEAIGLRLESRSWRDVVWQDRVDRGQFQFIQYGWIADYPDPENFVFLLYGPNKRPGPNHAAYNNPEYNRIFEQMRAMDDGPERLRLIRRLRDIAVEDCPWIFMEHGENLVLNYDWLKNVKSHPVANDVTKYLAVDGRTRVRRQQEWNRPNYWPLLGMALFLVAGSIPAAGTVQRRRTRRVRRSAGQAR